ncbi:MAG: AMP-binding protein [Gammaproteobacteria bacterium]|nr:AMP-binding protein [Gammaproteobacteria bacterium]
MDRVWLKHYPEGVPVDIDDAGPASLVAMCEEACSRFADRSAFGNFGTYLSFEELDAHSRAFAAYLQQRLGIARGDRVAIMMPNVLQYPVALLGVLRAGGVVVNTNPQYTARELLHQLRDSGARAIVVMREMLPVLATVIAETALEHVIETRVGDLLAWPRSILYDFVAARRAKSAPRAALPSAVHRFPDVLAAGRRLALDAPALGPEDLAFLQYTGGTTGTSKGAMLSHGNVVANVRQVTAWFNGLTTPGSEIIVTALPLYHIYALSVNCFTFMWQGGLNYLVTNPRDLTGFVKDIARIPFTAITGVNTLFNHLAMHPGFRTLDFSHLRFTSGGGMAVQRPVAEAWQELTGSVIIEGYGLTEASPVVTINLLASTGFTGLIGVPMPSTECRVVDDEGRDVAPGDSGELWVRGPQVMRGYWQRPEETAQVITGDGWLKTGDIAVMSEDGLFKIVDRKKDMILVSGFNVYPNEIEEVVASHPGVLEVAAVGVPDRNTGEAVKVIIVRSDKSLTAESVIEHCRGMLTGYKIPRHVAFATELPKSNVGKILRRTVRDIYGDESPAG